MNNEKNKVLFINTLYEPGKYQRQINHNMQVELFFCHIQIEHEENGDQYNIMLRKQSLANRLRESMHIAENK